MKPKLTALFVELKNEKSPDINFKMNKIILSLAFSTILFLNLFSQNQKLPSLADKPGTFEILSRTDYVMPESDFTKAEVSANLRLITELVGIVRQNPVLADIKGFMGRARIYAHSLPNNCGYGLPSRISFEFSDYLYHKDKISYNTIEPPSWSVFVNIISGSGYWNNFNTEKCMFTIPFNKKTIAPGIDVYDDYTFVIYDPTRPPYWVPVLVEEAIVCAREEAKKEKDEIAAKYLNEFLEKEFAALSPANLKKPAYFGGGISRVSDSPDYDSQKNIFPPIVKVNPEYWNKNLPKSAIQFIVLQMPMDKDYMQREYEDCLKHQNYGETCNLRRFMVAYSEEDIRKLFPLIGK